VTFQHFLSPEDDLPEFNQLRNAGMRQLDVAFTLEVGHTLLCFRKLNFWNCQTAES
jgi:hypothetical protein